jgi:tetratricopeptide (TPR) repeat protein
MMRRYLRWVVFLLAIVLATLPPRLTVAAGRPEGGMLEVVDRRLDQGAAAAALERLNDIAKDDVPAVELYWRRARARYPLGLAAAGEEREEQFRRAEAWARQAISAGPETDEGYKWLAIALGARAGESGPAAAAGLAKEIRAAVDHALAIDPDDDISLLVLGMWHYRIASCNPLLRSFARFAGGLPPASLAAAEDALCRAIAIHDRIMHRYYLGRVYHEQGLPAAAIAQLEHALSLPVSFPGEERKRLKIRQKLKRWRAALNPDQAGNQAAASGVDAGERRFIGAGVAADKVAR